MGCTFWEDQNLGTVEPVCKYEQRSERQQSLKDRTWAGMQGRLTSVKELIQETGKTP